MTGNDRIANWPQSYCSTNISSSPRRLPPRGYREAEIPGFHCYLRRAAANALRVAGGLDQEVYISGSSLHFTTIALTRQK